MVDVLHTVIQTILYVRSSEVCNLYHARRGMYHHRVASKVIVMNDHRITAHFIAMTKPSETLFHGTPENWPAFEHNLLTEAKNPTISWNQDITNYQPTDGNSEPFNFLERYFDLPYNMKNRLMDKLAGAKIIDLVSPASQLYKLHCLKTKLKNCLITDLTYDIDASIPIGPSNKYGRLFFIKLVPHT
jgi:hypothetical protein